ncbi:MAG: DegT/DnrJ/EryC1/StrS family aminotransferase [Lentisphaeria bacterium]|nr:DegT/DnrJ/EryC1/StrS family aminotransferase [Lentisphaeria bacterium]
MMTQADIQQALQKRPAQPWRAEPLLGSIYGQEEIDAAVAAIREAMDVSKGFGFTASPIPEFESAFANYTGTADAVAVNSAGPGIDIVMRALKLQPGDEVIVPSINYQAAPLAVLGAGGKVVWGEADPVTYMLDPADVERKITNRTRAIFPVHIHGLSAPMDDYLAIAERHPHPVYGPPKVVGDAARACGGSYRGTKIGKKGWATIYSFHTMKNMTTLGEGGMIATDDLELAAYARSVRMYGSGVEAWGTSNVMTKVQAAVGLVQLSKLDSFIANRRRVAQERNRLLQGLPGVTLPHEPADCEHSYYLYTVTLKDEWAGEKRNQLIKMMDQDYGVGCVVANPPSYLARRILAENFGKTTPLSEAYAAKMISISLHPSMTSDDNQYIAAAFITCTKKL